MQWRSDPARPAQRSPSRHRWAGGAFNAAVLVIMLFVVSVRQGYEEFPGSTLLVFTVLAWLPLLVRTRAPLAALIGCVSAESLHLIFVPLIVPDLNTPVAIAAYQPVPLATMAAAWTLASRSSRILGWVGGAGAATTLLVVGLLAQPLDLIATDLVMFNLVLMATATGVFVAAKRDRAARLVRERREETERQVVAERLRIARDLHDVLAHHLTLVNAQAGVAQYLLRTNPHAAATALQGMTQHTRDALDELRATVGLLRPDGDPPPVTEEADDLQPVPGLERLDHLLSGFHGAGATINVNVVGEPQSLPPSADLAAYRIIQEALTNAMKHAPGAAAHLTMRWDQHRLELLIENGAATSRPDPAALTGTGNGLIGMRERAQSCGGTLNTEQLRSGGYVVNASIPIPDKAQGRSITSDLKAGSA